MKSFKFILKNGGTILFKKNTTNQISSLFLPKRKYVYNSSIWQYYPRLLPKGCPIHEWNRPHRQRSIY